MANHYCLTRVGKLIARGMALRKRTHSGRRPQRLRRRVALGAATAGLEHLEPRTLLAAVSWISDTDGFWDESSNWSTGAVPQPGDDVILDVAEDVTVTYRDGNLSIASLESAETLVMAGGSLEMTERAAFTGSLDVHAGAAFAVDDGSFEQSGGRVTNAGEIVLDGDDLVLADSAQFINAAGGHLETSGTRRATLPPPFTIRGGSRLINEDGGTVESDGFGLEVIGDESRLENAGSLMLPNSMVGLAEGAMLTNSGTIQASGASFGINPNAPAPFVVHAGSSLINEPGGIVELTSFDLQVTGTESRLDNAGWFILHASDLSNTALRVGGDAELVNRAEGSIVHGSATVIPPLDMVIVEGGEAPLNVAGTLNNSGTVYAISVDLDGGVLLGDGTIEGDVLNEGLVTPGLSPGVLTINGNYTQTEAGLLEIEIGGTEAGSEHDQLDVSGTSTLDGMLRLLLIDAYSPEAGQEFQLMQPGRVQGSFGTVDVSPAGSASFELQAGPAGLLATAIDSPALTGDYNGNGIVEQDDLDLVLLHWGEDGSTPPPGWINDLPTGRIDQAELDAVLLNWGETLPARAMSAPSALASLEDQEAALRQGDHEEVFGQSRAKELGNRSTSAFDRQQDSVDHFYVRKTAARELAVDSLGASGTS